MPQVLTHALIPTFLQLILIPGHWPLVTTQPSFPRDHQPQTPDHARLLLGTMANRLSIPAVRQILAKLAKGEKEEDELVEKLEDSCLRYDHDKKGVLPFNYRGLL